MKENAENEKELENDNPCDSRHRPYGPYVHPRLLRANSTARASQIKHTNPNCACRADAVPALLETMPQANLYVY